MGGLAPWVGGGAVGALVYGVISIARMLLLQRRKVVADTGVTEIDGASRLSQQTLDAMARLTSFYEERIKSIQLDAQNQIASARADAANAAATALREVGTARAEVSEARRAAEAVEERLRRAALEAWRPDFSVERLRVLLSGGDGGSPVNGAPLGVRQ